MWKFVALIFLLKICAGKEVVRTKYGDLKGTTLVSSGGREFSAFLGVPYAKPPVGDLRFRSPEEPDSWDDIRDAIKEGPFCIQLDIFQNLTFLGEEDCLYLNVYTPQVGNDRNFDVLVWIHGGGFMSGSGSSYWFGPKYLLDRDVVLVTMNYRLGALGFLSTEDVECPGNMGLKDQNLVLRWVKDNIAAFGGNPLSVTIFGESAGGASVHFHMLSPMSQGLFHRAISQSGNALCPWAQSENPAARAVQLGFLLGCPTNTSVLLLECLRRLDAATIAKSHADMLKFTLDPIVPFGPAVEVASNDPFLPDDPYSLMVKKNYAPIPWITGVTTHEGGIRLVGLLEDRKKMEKLNKDFLKIAPVTFNYEDTAVDSTEISQKIRKFYFDSSEIGDETIEELTQLYSDRYHVHCAYLTANGHAEKNPTYFYVFRYRGKYSSSSFLSQTNNSRDLGVVHLDDLLYLFDSVMAPEFSESEPEKAMSDMVINLWLQFAKTGEPTSPGQLVKWPQVTFAYDIYFGLRKFPHLNIEPEMGVSWDFPYKRMEFWNSLPLRENGRRDRAERRGGFI